ncbi:unnamed protein product [Somion occarium]|uniref:Ubiquinol-cytochrome C reductase hinge domain-containing protein n=1 Tax=Somion occarium TaxID=3059160 RepID=A0ABP1CV24_9APHY
MLSTLFSSFVSTVHCDAPSDESKEGLKALSGEGEGEAKKEPEEEEEEEEPEDIMPVLQEECQETAKCAPLASHFAHCEEKVNEGKGYHGEDCVEEFCTFVPSIYVVSANLVHVSCDDVILRPLDALCERMRRTKTVQQAQVDCSELRTTLTEIF